MDVLGPMSLGGLRDLVFLFGGVQTSLGPCQRDRYVFARYPRRSWEETTTGHVGQIWVQDPAVVDSYFVFI